jgi:hypothetical protein
VRGVLGNFVFYRFNPQTSAIWIGVKGTGVAPNYKIEEPIVPVTVMVGSYPLKTGMTARTFSGRDHREMVELDDLERHGEAWSTASVSFAELKMLLSNLSQSECKALKLISAASTAVNAEPKRLSFSRPQAKGLNPHAGPAPGRGVSDMQAAQDLGVHPTQLRNWAKAFADGPQHAPNVTTNI